MGQQMTYLMDKDHHGRQMSVNVRRLWQMRW